MMVVCRLSGYPVDLNRPWSAPRANSLPCVSLFLPPKTARRETLNGIANGLAAARGCV
ncbi:hypothetical protein X777_03782 [Ooceraea biroi]|uniref:Uncharacterized protein n=1 Tax=Ooceraea biroi TaxID=2015173 RepID=A0A026WHQ9_OOCBI|nr:hypothetical protein X777_03782 [Ooceraea biroi]